MGEVHDLLNLHGKQATLALDIDRRVVDVASDYLGDEESGIGFIYSGWAQAALPHKRLPDHQPLAGQDGPGDLGSRAWSQIAFEW
jgi:hypothetical protein